jgi:hypothetical protein
MIDCKAAFDNAFILKITIKTKKGVSIGEARKIPP